MAGISGSERMFVTWRCHARCSAPCAGSSVVLLPGSASFRGGRVRHWAQVLVYQALAVSTSISLNGGEVKLDTDEDLYWTTATL